MFTSIQRLEPLDFVSVYEAKNHLNIIDNDEDDLYIRSLVDTAQEMVEKGTNRLLSKCSVSLEVTHNNRSFFLPYGNVTEVVSCQSNGSDVYFGFSTISQRITIKEHLPCDSMLEINYIAGYESCDVPNSLKSAAKIIISDMYEYRESKVEASLSKAPMAAEVLMSAYRIPI